MSRYAEGTNVSVDRSIAEVRQILSRFGASGFGYIEQGDTVVVAFVYTDPTTKRESHVRITAAMPKRAEFRAATTHLQRVRERWRAIVLTIKSKLVCVQDGIETFDQAFFAWIVVPGQDETMYEQMAPQLEAARAGRRNEPLLLSAPHPAYRVRIEESE